MNKKSIIGIIILLIGLFYTLAPHTMHISSGVGFGAEHTTHQILGVILIIIGIIAVWKMK